MLRMMVLALACLLALVSSTTNGHHSYGYGSYFPHFSPLPFDRSSNPLLHPAADSPQSMMDEGNLQARGFGVISIMLLSQITTRLVQLEEMVNNMGNTNGQGNTDELESLKLKLAKIESSQTNLEGTVTGIISNVTLLEATVTGIISNVTLLEATVNVTASDLTAVQLNQTYLESNLTVTTNEQDSMKLNLTKLEGTVNTTLNDLASIQLSLTYLGSNFTVSVTDLANIKSNLTLFEVTVNGTTSDLTAVQLKQTYLEGNLTVTANEQAGMKLNVTYLQGNSTGNGLSVPTSIGGMPTSCEDLVKLGHTKSGIYNVKVDSKVAVIYCNFTKAVTDAEFEKQIGYAEVETQSVYFYVLLSREIEGIGGNYLPVFGSAKVNVGNAFDVTSSKFTAPSDGTYLFSFTATVEFRSAFSGVKSMYVDLIDDSFNLLYASTSAISAGQVNQVHFDHIVYLRKGDRIFLGMNADKGIYLLARRTSFYGMLLKEELFASV